MDPSWVYKGLFIGFTIAAPVGPIGILCIRRTLAEGRIAGVVCGLGAASADACYGFIAAFGLTWISTVLLSQSFYLTLIGGIFLCYLGINTFFSRPSIQKANVAPSGLMRAYFSTYLLTLTNPMTILMFLGVFAGIGTVVNGSYAAAGWIVFSVFIGSSAWWVLLCTMVGILRAHFTLHWMLWVNRISGLLITGFGFYQLMKLSNLIHIPFYS